MITKQINNIIPVIHRLVTDEYGENYWFNGCAAYVMEALGEPDYDYWLFGGVTGDNFIQFYPYKGYKGGYFRGESATEYRMGPDYMRWVFDQVGYSCAYVTERELLAEPELYLRKLMDCIDRGIPVIHYAYHWGVFVGYESGGETLLLITGDSDEPKRLAVGIDFLIEINSEEQKDFCGWIFIGEKRREIPLAQIYREAILRLPELLTTKTSEYVFGARAFRAWADDIENGRFDAMPREAFDGWAMYANYACNLATNSGGCQGFLQKAMELNPDMAFLAEVGRQYKTINYLWNRAHWRRDVLDRKERRAYAHRYGRSNLESLKLGILNFSDKAFFNRRKRKKAVALIREMASCADEAVRILEEGALGV